MGKKKFTETPGYYVCETCGLSGTAQAIHCGQLMLNNFLLGFKSSAPKTSK